MTFSESNDIIGEVAISDAEKIIVSITKWKSEYYVDIRKFINSFRYTGPTKQGVRIHLKGLKKIINVLSDNNLDGSYDDNYIIGVVPRDSDRDIVLKTSMFTGNLKLDIRERISSRGKVFYTKKGITIPTRNIKHLKEVLVEARWALENNYPDHEFF